MECHESQLSGYLRFERKMIRSYQPKDYEAIAEIFSRSVHEIASEAYSQEQCKAWSEKTPNTERWKKRCTVKQPLVFVIDGTVAGFLELDNDGHIDCMYVHPDYARQGIASRLIDHAVAACVDAGLQRVFVEASICAKPVFEKKGFQTIEERLAPIRGEKLVNYRMELKLQDPPNKS